MVTAPLCVIVALVTVKVVRAAFPPTASVNVTPPLVPPKRVKEVAPFTVDEKLIFAPADAPLVVLSVGPFVKLTGPVIIMAPPLVVID